MKVLFISTKFPWPIRGGREGTIDQYLNIIGQKHEVIFASFFGAETDRVPGYVSHRYHLTYPNSLEMGWSALINPLKPIQSHLFNGVRTRREIRDICAAHNPDVIIYDMIRCISLAQDRGVRRFRRIIDMDDLLSNRYRRWLDLRLTNITGSFEGAIPPFVRRFIASFARPIIRLEGWLVQRAEARSFDVFGGAIFVSISEANEFLAGSRKTGPVAVVRRAVSSVGRPALRAGERPSFFFLGNFHTPANLVTLQRLDRIVGMIDETLRSRFRFFTIGAPSKEYSTRNVEQLGFVDEIHDHIDDKSILIAPMVTGTGVKIKVMESLAV